MTALERWLCGLIVAAALAVVSGLALRAYGATDTTTATPRRSRTAHRPMPRPC